MQGKKRALCALAGAVGLGIFFILLKFATGEILSSDLSKLTIICKEAKRRTVSAIFRTRFSRKLGGGFTMRKWVRLPRIVTHLSTLDGTGDLGSFILKIYFSEWNVFAQILSLQGRVYN